MGNVRISRALSARVASVLEGSHSTLDALFLSAGAPGPPPDLSHATKWKTWVFETGRDPEVDSLEFLGNLVEEFMDCPPSDPEFHDGWAEGRASLVEALEEAGFRYFRGGRILPNGASPDDPQPADESDDASAKVYPSSIDELLSVLVKGLPRAIHPLTHRRKGTQPLQFSSEYDVQDLLHALMRPWVGDIRPEEFTPSYAGTSTRMDFLLPKHGVVIELKFVRDRAHGTKIGDELIVDIEHYRRHPDCRELWCVVYDPNQFLRNAEGLSTDLDGERSSSDGTVNTRVMVL